MSESLLSLAGALAAEVAAVIVVRAMPFSVWALASRHIRLPEKASALLLYASLIALARSRDRLFLDVLVTLAQGLSYLTACACVLVYFANRRRIARAPRPALLLACVGAFLVVPGLSIRGPGALAVLMAGWELSFAGYSYTVEVGARAAPASMRDGLFFLLVNPVLCYPERGGWMASAPTLRASLGRALAGVLLVAAAIITVSMLAMIAVPAHDLTTFGYAGFVVHQGGGIVRTYFAHAGVAHLQLGLLAAVGYRAPNRYERPWLASGPADFWRRWNVYVGSWFRRYVFLPLSLRLARRTRLGSELRTSLAVMLTFAAAGLAHDLVWLIEAGRFGTGVLAFGFQGLVVLAFEFASRSDARAQVPQPVSALAQRVGFWHALMVMAWLLKPGG